MNLLMYYLRYLKEKKKKLGYFKLEKSKVNCRVLKYEEYNKKDLRKKFVDEFKKMVKKKLNIEIYNCNFFAYEDSEELNVIIYFDNLSPEEIGIDSWNPIDKNHNLVKIFYKVLKKYKLPGINKNTKIVLKAKNYLTYYLEEVINKVIKESLKFKNIDKEFSVIATRNEFILGLKDELYNDYINKEKPLKKYRKILIECVKKFDTENRIDLNKIVVYVEPLSKWNKWIMYQHRDENCLEGVKKIEPTTDENEGRNKIKGKPINEKCFYKIYIFLSTAMAILLIISLIFGSLIKLFFLGLLLPIYLLISAVFFFGYLKTSKSVSAIVVSVLLLFSILNYKYILDTKAFFAGEELVEIGTWEELSKDSFDYIMIKNKPIRNYYTIGRINNTVFKIKEKLINGEKYKIKYLPNTKLVVLITRYNKGEEINTIS